MLGILALGVYRFLRDIPSSKEKVLGTHIRTYDLSSTKKSNKGRHIAMTVMRM